MSFILDIFKKKGTEVIEKNKIAANTGYNYVKKNFPTGYNRQLTLIPQKSPQILIAGNEAMGMRWKSMRNRF